MNADIDRSLKPRPPTTATCFTETLIRIPVHQVVKQDSYTVHHNGNNLCFSPQKFGNQTYVVLDVNNFRQPIRWLLDEIPITGKLQRNGYIPWDSDSSYYVVGSDGRRCRCLYINPITNTIGTRTEFRNNFKIRYKLESLSKRQRHICRAEKAASKGNIIETVEFGPPKKSNDALLVGRLRMQIDQMKYKK